MNFNNQPTKSTSTLFVVVRELNSRNLVEVVEVVAAVEAELVADAKSQLCMTKSIQNLVL